MLDYYLVIGAKPDASHEQIKAAYRKKALACHPDRGGSVRDMQLLNEAWAVLGEPAARREYDAEWKREVVVEPVGSAEKRGEKAVVAEDPVEETVISEIGGVVARVSFFLGKLIGLFASKPVKGKKRGR